MTQTKFHPHMPEGMFIVRVARIVKHDTCHKMHYEYSYTVDLRPCACDFVAAFADLVRTLGKAPAAHYTAPTAARPASGVGQEHRKTSPGSMTFETFSPLP